MRRRAALAAAALALVTLISCDQFSLMAELKAIEERSRTAGLPLSINPSAMTLQVNATYVFYGLGGNPPYTYAVASPVSGGGTVAASTGVYTAPGSVPGSDVTLQVTDSSGATATSTVTIVPVGGLPLTLNPSTITLQLNANYGFYAIGGAPPYTYSVVNPPPPAGGTVNGVTGVYAAPAALPGSDVTLSVSDSLGATNTSIVTLVDGSSGPLSMNPATLSLGVNNSYGFYGLGGTPPYSYAVINPPPPGGGTINGTTGVYTAPAALPGSDVTIRVSDSVAGTSDATVTITAPAVAISPGTVSITPSSTQVLTAVGGTPPYGFVLESGGGSISFVSATQELYTAPAGPTVAVVRVNDSAGATNVAVVNVEPPPALTLNPSTITLQANAVYAFYALGGTPGYTFSVFSGGGSIVPATGVFTAPGGADTVILRVTDSLAAVASATVTVVSSGALGVSPAGPVTIEQGTTLSFSGFGGMPPYVYSISPTDSDASINSGSGVFTALGSAVPGASYTVTVTDSDGPPTASAAVTIAPAAPTNLVADGSAGGPQDIQLTWADNATGESGYEIWEKEGVGAFVLIHTTGPGATGYMVTSRTPNTPYTYKVRALKNPAIYSSYSEAAFAVPNY